MSVLRPGRLTSWCSSEPKTKYWSRYPSCVSYKHQPVFCRANAQEFRLAAYRVGRRPSKVGEKGAPRRRDGAILLSFQNTLSGRPGNSELDDKGCFVRRPKSLNEELGGTRPVTHVEKLGIGPPVQDVMEISGTHIEVVEIQRFKFVRIYAVVNSH